MKYIDEGKPTPYEVEDPNLYYYVSLSDKWFHLLC